MSILSSIFKRKEKEATPIAQQEKKKDMAKTLPDEIATLYENIERLQRTNFNPKFDDFGETAEEILKVVREMDILKELQERLPGILNDKSFSRIFTALSETVDKHSVLLKDMKSLFDEEKKLTGEIMQFSKTASEMGNRFRLSPNWEGKKPQMIALGRQLDTRRQELLKSENTLTEQLREMQGDLAYSHEMFCSGAEGISSYIKKNLKL